MSLAEVIDVESSSSEATNSDAVSGTTASHHEIFRKRSNTVTFHPTTTISVAEDEIDTVDHNDSSVPLHNSPEMLMNLEISMESVRSNEKNLLSSNKRGLTLSAFRRSSVRLTRAEPGRKLEDYYDIRQNGQFTVLGHGAFSTVRMATRKADKLLVAVKSIAKHEALRARRVRVGKNHMEEWDILKKMRNHPFIVNLLELFETEDEIILVMEYCQGGELFNAIQRRRNRKQAMRRGQYTETQSAVITSQILKALADLHDSGIVHRDVKPENVLLTDDKDDNRIRVKLCDFGMARSLMEDSSVGESSHEDGTKSGESSPQTPSRSRAYSIIGSNYYAAPEICYGNPYDTAVDIYSLGVTLYILLCGFPPCFAGSNSEEVLFPNAYWSDVSDDAKELLKKMLHHNPSERITAREALRDKWIWQHLQSSRHRPSVLKPRVARFASPERCTNLDLVRNQLYQKLSLQASMKRAATATVMPESSAPKRHRFEQRQSSTALIALADLYRDVSQSPAAKVLSTNVVVDVSSAPKTPSAESCTGCFGDCASPLRPLSV